jgi:hypothetical protein
VLDLAHASDRSRSDQIAFGAIQRQIEVQHGLEWESI